MKSKKSRYDFDTSMEGFKRCKLCGYVEALGVHEERYEGVIDRLDEKYIHSTFHGKFTRVQKAHSDVILPHIDLVLAEKGQTHIKMIQVGITAWQNERSTVAERTIGLKNIDDGLYLYYQVEFTKSLRLWDYCKAHPLITDYTYLLWNTPRFQKIMQTLLPPELYRQYRSKYRANRRLSEIFYKDAPFFFGDVIPASVKMNNGTDLPYVDMTDMHLVHIFENEREDIDERISCIDKLEAQDDTIILAFQSLTPVEPVCMCQ